ncbi:MAG: glycosyltransferase family 4 protein [Eubacterium sp.]|nr:glycosyltransferase family 4 protein [Eubacterium sp.]
MKILMVNKFLYKNGGSETYMMKLGEYLASIGHEVEYFGMSHEGNCVFNSADSYTSDMDFHTASAFEKISMSFKTIYSKEARQKISLVLDKFQPDAVHLNNFNYQLTPSIILEIREWEKRNGKNVKIVYTAHDYQLVCPNHMLNNPASNEICEKCIGGGFLNCAKGKCIHSSFIKSLFGTLEAYYWNKNKVYANIDTIICCSEFMKTKLDTNPVLAKKTVALHNFIQDVSAQNFDKKPYVLYFGRFSQEKGVKTLLKACRALPEIRFVFAGSGPLENELGEADNVSNVGFKSGGDLYNLIAQARFSVYPSEWYENCPYSVMESITLGTPVIGADIGGIPELIENGETGLLFESGNAEELKEKIKSLYFDENALEKMNASCRKKRFISIEEYTNTLLQYYA